MSSISNTGVNATHSKSTYTYGSTTNRDADKTTTTAGQEHDGDTVEISEAARELLATEEAAGSQKPFTWMDPDKVLIAGSEEEKEFKELLKSVKEQKSDVMSHIQGALEKAGISLSGLGKLKVEVDSAGRIVCDGITDKKTLRAIEKALNRDKSLASKLQKFHVDEKNLSKLVNDYTGCTLYELTMTARGDINERIRTVVESQTNEAMRDEFYYNLYFLGETRDAVVSLDDVLSLGFGGQIDFSGEIDTMADPEGNIKKSLDDMYQKVKEAFDEINNELAARVNGGEVDEDFKARYFLDPSKVVITVDNLGGLTIDGLLAGNEATHKKGVDIIKKLVHEMLNDSETNSYHLPLFTAASDNLIAGMAEELGLEGEMGWNAKVVASISHGVAGDIRITAPGAEAKAQSDLQDTVNRMIREAGIAIAEPITVEIDDSGKIRAVGLAENAPENKRIQELLDRINADLERTAATGGNAGKAGKETGPASWHENIANLSRYTRQLQELRGQ